MLEAKIVNSQNNKPSICIVGIGGAGNNAVDRMIKNDNRNVKYIAINTDNQVLTECKAETTLQIGAKLTGGNGAGADPMIGEAAAEESKNDIKELLSDADMVILTCGLGGGTGTGAIPIIAKLCKEAGILTIAVVTLPFSFEGPSRVLSASDGLNNLLHAVDTLLVVPNDRLLEISDKDLDLEDAFLMADNVLKHTIEGVTNIIFNKGIVNIDFNDIRTTLKDKGIGHLGIGIANESKPLIEAVKDAIAAPLLTTDITNAKNILINTAGRVKMKEVNEAIQYVKDLAGPEVQIIWGTVTDEEKSTDNTSIVTLIATGLKEHPSKPICVGSKQSAITRPSVSIKPDPPKRINIIQTAPARASVQAKELAVPEFLKNYGLKKSL
ncbi:MAG: cell division protein FtsZ [Lachnospiraceae bacterium]|nr:cell division protein FtsZ [Lachnospiraceae bacterium]